MRMHGRCHAPPMQSSRYKTPSCILIVPASRLGALPVSFAEKRIGRGNTNPPPRFSSTGCLLQDYEIQEEGLLDLCECGRVTNSGRGRIEI